MLDVLDEAFNLACGISLGGVLAGFFGLSLFVPRQSFPKHINQRTIARQENRVLLFVRLGAVGDEVQACQCLASARYAIICAINSSRARTSPSALRAFASASSE